MKIAAGCFGCLAFIFFGLSLAFSVGWGFIASMLPPELVGEIGMSTVYIQWVNSGCCCLSAILAVVFLVVGSMGKKTEEYE